MINEQLYINNISVPLTKALGVALTKSIQDIKEPNKRKTTYSKTVSLPDSKVLRQVFDHFFELNLVDRTFNPLSKADCRYEVASEVILNGYLQLKSVTVVDEEQFTYEVVLFGELGNFFESIKDAKLEDLDFSIYNHILNREVQQESWDSQIIKSGSFVPFNLGEGYVYPLVDYGFSSDAVTFESTDIGTSIYVRQYWENIFSDAGYTWTSTFLDSTLFKSLIIPSSPETFLLTSSEIADREFTANTPELDSTGTTTSGNLPNLVLSTRDKIINTNELADTGGIYDPVTGVFTCVSAGIYTFEFTVQIDATFTPTDGVTLYKLVSEADGYLMLHKTPVATGTAVQVASTPFYITMDDTTFYAGARSTDTTPTIGDKEHLDQKRWSEVPPTSPIGSTNVARITASAPNLYSVKVVGLVMAAGDKLEPSWKAGMFSSYGAFIFQTSLGSFGAGTVTLDFPSSSFYSKIENGYTYAGSSLAINKTIPKNIKQTDFILAFVKMFNLFIDVDPTNPKNLLIEPRDDYYNSTIVNIHEKIDRSKDYTLEPTTALNALKYIYKYKDDKDYFNELYLTSWVETYGSAEVDVTHDFGRDIDKTEVLFSPTPSVSLPFNNRVLPTIQQRDDAGQPISTKHNIRVLYYGGMKDCTLSWNHLEDVSAMGGIPFPDYLTQYPYAGMWDDPYDPTFDLSFNLVKEVYYWSSPFEPINATDNNLFNAYHGKMIREYTDEDSRILECYVDMNQVDWAEWTFDKLYYFDFAYFRLYKIFDYNPSSAETTKVQFLKIKEASLFIPSTGVSNGSDDLLVPDQSGGQIDTGTTLPVLPSGGKTQDTNIGQGDGKTMNGSQNYIDPLAKRVEIQGDGNRVYSDAYNIKLVNSNDNVIDGGVRNVTLINTDNQTITESNQVWLNGKKYTTMDYKIEHAIDVISSTYGDTVSVDSKKKDLIKFGRNLAIGTTKTTLFNVPSYANETYQTQNLYTHFASADATDAGIITIEGHVVGDDVSVSTLTQTAGLATCTTSTAHGFSSGEWVNLLGANQTEYNGVFQVTVTSTTVFTFAVDSGATSPATGTITVNSQNLTFVTQDVTLAGQTKTALTTPLARAARAYLKEQDRVVELGGPVYVSLDVAYSSGVPSQASFSTPLAIPQDKQQSEKGATSLSNTDYWIVTGFSAGYLTKSGSNTAEVSLEIRKQGGVFRPTAKPIVISTGQEGERTFDPYIVVPKNADIRLVAVASTGNQEITGDVYGYLATTL